MSQFLRKPNVRAVVLVLSIFVTGCTFKMFKNYDYNEKLSSVLISQDKKKIVIIGEQYHYIFDAPTELVNALESSIHSKITAGFNGFKVTKDNVISGVIVLSVRELSDIEFDIAKDIGFEIRTIKPAGKPSERYIDYRYVSIKGMRYDAKEFRMPNTNNFKLNKPYVVSIEAERTTIEKWLRVPLTPVTVAIDGTVILGAIILWPIAILPELHRHN